MTCRAGDAAQASPLIAARTRASTVDAIVLQPVNTSSETWLTITAGDTVEASPLIAARTRASTGHAMELRRLHASSEA